MGAFWSINIGPGVNPLIMKPPNIRAAAKLPGIPNVTRGIKFGPTTALFPDSQAARPSKEPFPKRSGCLDALLAPM